MSTLKPFYIKSLEHLREELGLIDKSSVTYNGLEQLLPKYRDWLVGSGAYNDLSRLLSANQYVTDLDQLDALRVEMIGKVNAAIASMQDQHRNAETIADMPIPQKAGPLRWRPASLPSGTGNFLHRMLDAFRAKDALSQAGIIVTVIATVGGGAITAARTYESWLVPALQYIHLLDRPVAAEKKALTSIFLECNLGSVPRVFPPSGRLYITNILPSLIDEKVSLSLGYRFGSPGATSLPENVVEWAYECKVTNYGNSPVFNVVVPIQVIFREAHRPTNQPDAWQSGAIKAVKETSIAIAKIDTGKDNPFVFYLSSQSPDFIELKFLETVKLQEGTDEDTKPGRLIFAANSRVQFSPNEAFQIKTPIHPSPAPQPSPH
jgi:hypothetical protein